MHGARPPGLRRGSRIYLLPLDRNRTVFWRSQGSFDKTKGRSPDPALERLTHAHSSVRKIVG
jgi:hypothetical protein